LFFATHSISCQFKYSNLLGIGLIAIGIGAISKKVISYPTGGCMKGTQELTLNKGIKKFII